MTNVTLITTQTTDPLRIAVLAVVHAHLQAQIASKVRQARSNVHMSRRVLAEKSGVSQRYLAQLESAEGNISIALLLRVAMALDLQLEWLLKDADPVDQDLTKLLALYQKADPTLRARIMEQLEDSQNAMNGPSGFVWLDCVVLANQRLGRWRLIVCQFRFWN